MSSCYGWVGGSGTAAHVAPTTGTIGVLLTQVPMTGPTPTPLMRRFWEHAFDVSDASQTAPASGPT